MAERGAQPGQRCAIGPYRLDAQAEILTRDGAPLPVGRRAVGLLLMLLRRPGEVVTKDELIAGVWGGLIVEESNLTSQVAALRRVFARNQVSEDWIETLPRRGYRFVGPVAWDGAEAPATALAGGASSRVLEGTPSLAILPFKLHGHDDVPTYVANGLVEDIVSALASLPELTVISPGSTLRFRDSILDLASIGDALNARYLVRGSVRRGGDRMRVTVELSEAATGAVISSRAHDGDWNAMFDAQDRIVEQIVHALAPRVRDQELRRVCMKRPEALVAYDLVLQARALIYRPDRARFADAKELLAEAIVVEPTYAAAHALSAEWHTLRMFQNWSDDREADAAAVERHATLAVSLDPSDSRALTHCAHSRALLHRDYVTALALYERALESSPSSAVAWAWSSATHAFLGDGAEAVARAERGLRLSPRDWFSFNFYRFLCLAHYTAGSYAEAARWGLACIAENPRFVSNIGYTVAALVGAGDLEQARILARNEMVHQPNFRVGPVVARHPYSDAARREQYGRHLREAGFPP